MLVSFIPDFGLTLLSWMDRQWGRQKVTLYKPSSVIYQCHIQSSDGGLWGCRRVTNDRNGAQIGFWSDSPAGRVLNAGCTALVQALLMCYRATSILHRNEWGGISLQASFEEKKNLHVETIFKCTSKKCNTSRTQHSISIMLRLNNKTVCNSWLVS